MLTRRCGQIAGRFGQNLNATFRGSLVAPPYQFEHVRIGCPCHGGGPFHSLGIVKDDQLSGAPEGAARTA